MYNIINQSPCWIMLTTFYFITRFYPGYHEYFHIIFVDFVGKKMS